MQTNRLFPIVDEGHENKRGADVEEEKKAKGSLLQGAADGSSSSSSSTGSWTVVPTVVNRERDSGLLRAAPAETHLNIGAVEEGQTVDTTSLSPKRTDDGVPRAVGDVSATPHTVATWRPFKLTAGRQSLGRTTSASLCFNATPLPQQFHAGSPKVLLCADDAAWAPVAPRREDSFSRPDDDLTVDYPTTANKSCKPLDTQILFAGTAGEEEASAVVMNAPPSAVTTNCTATDDSLTATQRSLSVSHRSHSNAEAATHTALLRPQNSQRHSPSHRDVSAIWLSHSAAMKDGGSAALKSKDPEDLQMEAENLRQVKGFLVTKLRDCEATLISTAAERDDLEEALSQLNDSLWEKEQVREENYQKTKRQLEELQEKHAALEEAFHLSEQKLSGLEEANVLLENENTLLRGEAKDAVGCRDLERKAMQNVTNELCAQKRVLVREVKQLRKELNRLTTSQSLSPQPDSSSALHSELGPPSPLGASGLCASPAFERKTSSRRSNAEASPAFCSGNAVSTTTPLASISQTALSPPLRSPGASLQVAPGLDEARGFARSDGSHALDAVQTNCCVIYDFQGPPAFVPKEVVCTAAADSTASSGMTTTATTASDVSRGVQCIARDPPWQSAAVSADTDSQRHLVSASINKHPQLLSCSFAASEDVSFCLQGEPQHCRFPSSDSECSPSTLGSWRGVDLAAARSARASCEQAREYSCSYHVAVIAGDPTLTATCSGRPTTPSAEPSLTCSALPSNPHSSAPTCLERLTSLDKLMLRRDAASDFSHAAPSNPLSRELAAVSSTFTSDYSQTTRSHCVAPQPLASNACRSDGEGMTLRSSSLPFSSSPSSLANSDAYPSAVSATALQRLWSSAHRRLMQSRDLIAQQREEYIRRRGECHDHYQQELLRWESKHKCLMKEAERLPLIGFSRFPSSAPKYLRAHLSGAADDSQRKARAETAGDSDAETQTRMHEESERNVSSTCGGLRRSSTDTEGLAPADERKRGM